MLEEQHGHEPRHAIAQQTLVWIPPRLLQPLRWSVLDSVGVTCWDPCSSPAEAEGRTRAPRPFGGVSLTPRVAVLRAEGT